MVRPLVIAMHAFRFSAPKPRLTPRAPRAKDNSPMIHHGVSAAISIVKPWQGRKKIRLPARQMSFVPNGTFQNNRRGIPVINHGAILGRPRGPKSSRQPQSQRTVFIDFVADGREFSRSRCQMAFPKSRLRSQTLLNLNRAKAPQIPQRN